MSIYVNGDLFSAMLDGGIRNLALHAKEVNDLNVFPVPDGDTGTNMSLTIATAAAGMRGKAYSGVSAAADAAASMNSRLFSLDIPSPWFCTILANGNLFRHQKECYFSLEKMTF